MKFTRLQILAHAGAALPLLWLVYDYFTGALTANPIQAITQRTGKTALILLVLTLAVTPLNTLFQWRSLLRLRRALGLWTFFYAGLHFLTFVGLDYGFQWEYLRQDLFEKRFALAGFTAGLLMLPLAITSTRGWQKRLGKRWKQLHRLVYLTGVLAVVHYIWLVKADIRQPLVFGGIVAVLLLLRVTPIRHKAAEWGMRLSSAIRQRILHIQGCFQK
jgi:sulfoxide reductase heme-binding subunit YedZ